LLNLLKKRLHECFKHAGRCAGAEDHQAGGQARANSINNLPPSGAHYRRMRMKKPWDCPRCGIKTTDFPAISRADNKTEVCSQCGTEEALIQALGMSETESRRMANQIRTATEKLSDFIEADNWK